MSGDSSPLFGVDYQGRVWTLQGAARSWSLLPNPTKLNIKRLVSFSNILWGIASDHQIYVYVPHREIQIRVREEIYENQRWNPVESFTGDHLLPTDRTPFSSEDGITPKEKTDKLPSEAWRWECDWQIENTFENDLIPDGWTYAIDFPATYHAKKTFKSFVRRRKLYRYRKYVATNRWVKMEALHADHTQEPFIDVSVGGLNNASHAEVCCLWAVSVLGEVYYRSETTTSNPEGCAWQHIPIRKGLEACQVAVARNGTPFVVTWTGTFMFRIGITPKNVHGTDWLESSGPPGGLLQIAAGSNCLWAVTRDKKCWALKGKWPEVIAHSEPNFEWIEIPGKMKSVVLGKSDDIVMALSDEEFSVLFLRVGISEEQTYGQIWKPLLENVPWDTVSEVSEDTTDGAEQSTESLVSLKPDLPLNSGFPVADQGSLVSNSFSWVDGSCVSCLRMGGVDVDLEVGPWRDNILQNLQKLNMEKSRFSYPEALESSNISWSKAARVKFLHISRNACWVEGQLEISNNNHLMFHEGLEKTWLCNVSDVLSVFGSVANSTTISLRIRNSLEPGVAEFVSFKFTNENDADDWKTTIADLSMKPLDEFSIADIWLSTRDGELHRGGQVRVLDAPVEMEVVSESGENSDFRLHHPLVHGFLPDSELTIDISIPSGAERFSVNLKGRTDNINAFHFNPRFSNSCVVRNSYDNGVWGEEEKDGVFPFREGGLYSISLCSTQTHIVTTVSQKKSKYIYNFKHRIPLKNICNLYINGDASVQSVRYNPKVGDTYELEFATINVPGHFWKVEAGSNGMVWALSYDLMVWCYTGSFKPKTEAPALGPVTDEHTSYVYENQRWNPLTGFTSNIALPTDRFGWTDETGRIRMEKNDIRPPSGRWTWVSDWEIDYDTPNGVDEGGWQYAIDFPASYHPHKRINDFARRRRWKRVSKLVMIGPWQVVPGMKLVDLSIRMNEDCEWEVLGLQENGDAVVRVGISPECPVGTGWESLPSEKPLVNISGWYGQRIWAVGKDGFAYIRYGNAWQMLDRPQGTPLKLIKVGSTSVWALGTNSVLYRRTEVQAIFPEGREWTKVCDNVIQVGIAPDGNVWALIKSDDSYRCSLAKRMGISQNNPAGLGWESIAAGPWRYFSAAGSFSRNK